MSLPLSAKSTTFLEISMTSSFATAVLLISANLDEQIYLYWQFSYEENKMIQRLSSMCLILNCFDIGQK